MKNSPLTVNLHAGRAVVKETGIIVVSISMDAVHFRLDHGLVVGVGQLDLRLGPLMMRIGTGLSGLDILLGDELGPLMAVLHGTALRLVIQGRLLLLIVQPRLGRAIIAGERRIIYTIFRRHLSIRLAGNCWTLTWSPITRYPLSCVSILFNGKVCGD